MEITRRFALKIIGGTPVAAGLGLGQAQAQAPAPAAAPPASPAHHAAVAKGPYKPKFFTAHEYATVTLLADSIIPKDDRSGSASEAGVPQFIDFTMTDRPEMQTWMRGGLRWLDHEANVRFGKPFVKCAEADRAAILDDIAYPLRVVPAFTQGASFFSSLRDLVATGFYTTRMGIQDLRYVGNQPTNWDGCPAECLDHLGLKA
jgi:gluconate 2-dehydrogenase subunit 3-like protein